MPDRIDTAALQPSRYAGIDADAAVDAPKGTWQGEAVRMEGPDLASLLDDAKEELTFAHAERMESKQLEEREIEEPDLERVDQAQAVIEYLNQVPDFDSGEFERLLQDLRSGDDREGGGQPDSGDVLDRARDHFPDPTHADAALALAEQAFRAEGRSALADAARDARTQHQGELGPSIRAGLNVGAAAHEAASGDRAAAQALRDGYRDTVFNAAGPAAVYRGILARLDAGGGEGGGGEMAAQLRFLTRALGDDLASEGPSIDPRLLRQLITDMSALRVLDTVHERCGQLAARVKRQSGVELQVPKVMQGLLPLTEEAVTSSARVLPIPGQLGIPTARLDTQVLFLREARDVLAGMPVAVFRDADARFAALRALQEAMDITIEREEAE